MTATRPHRQTKREMTPREKYASDVQWHFGAFLILSFFLWVIDTTLGQDGLQWAHWVIGFWGLALLFHVLAWLVDGRHRSDT